MYTLIKPSYCFDHLILNSTLCHLPFSFFSVSISIKKRFIFFTIASSQLIDVSNLNFFRDLSLFQFCKFVLFVKGPLQPFLWSYKINPFLREFVAFFCNCKSIGVFILKYLLSIGYEKVFISISYVLILIVVGFYMLKESISSLKNISDGKIKKLHDHAWFHGLPFKLKFRKSHLYISVLPPIIIGLIAGILSSVMGVGGGFILIPAMIYILGMPTQIVVGTSLMQIIFVTLVSTIMHSYINQTVDVVLSSLLLLGAVIGAQIGTRVMIRLKGEQIRFLFAIIIILVATVLLLELLVTPDNSYILEFSK